MNDFTAFFASHPLLKVLALQAVVLAILAIRKGFLAHLVNALFLGAMAGHIYLLRADLPGVLTLFDKGFMALPVGTVAALCLIAFGWYEMLMVSVRLLVVAACGALQVVAGLLILGCKEALKRLRRTPSSEAV